MSNFTGILGTVNSQLGQFELAKVPNTPTPFECEEVASPRLDISLIDSQILFSSGEDFAGSFALEESTNVQVIHELPYYPSFYISEESVQSLTVDEVSSSQVIHELPYYPSFYVSEESVQSITIDEVGNSQVIHELPYYPSFYVSEESVQSITVDEVGSAQVIHELPSNWISQSISEDYIQVIPATLIEEYNIPWSDTSKPSWWTLSQPEELPTGVVPPLHLYYLQGGGDPWTFDPITESFVQGPFHDQVRWQVVDELSRAWDSGPISWDMFQTRIVLNEKRERGVKEFRTIAKELVYKRQYGRIVQTTVKTAGVIYLMWRLLT